MVLYKQAKTTVIALYNQTKTIYNAIKASEDIFIVLYNPDKRLITL